MCSEYSKVTRILIENKKILKLKKKILGVLFNKVVK